jgi:formyltetrahydrofolate deformylase
MDWAIFYDAVPKKVAVFASKAGHCLWDLLLRHQGGDLPNCQVVAVIANHPDLAPVARTFGVPFFQVPSSTMDDPAGKAAQEGRIEEVLAQTGADLHVLARWMNVFSPAWCERHAAHTINIHHGFLPAFQGARPYHQAHARGGKVIGSSAHFATARLDEGPFIEQDVVRISHRDAPADMVRKGRDLERLVLAKAVRAVLCDRVLIHGSRTVVFDE